MPRTLLLLAPLALAAFAPAAGQAAEPPVAVTVTAKGCEPNEITVKAGRVTFQVFNKSSRALEWEILKGVMVVDERENIVPGFRQRLTTTLEPGAYEMTCGLLSNPRGRLVVLNAEGGQDAPAARPSAVELIGPAAEYRVWAAGEAGTLADAAERFGQAKTAGHQGEADTALAQARAAFLRLGVLAPLTGGRDGSAAAALRTGEGLEAPVAAFIQGLRALSPAPDILVAQAAAQASAAAAAPVEAAERLAGIARLVDLFDPLTARADRQRAQELRASLARAQAAAGGAEAAPALADLARNLGGLPAVWGL